MDGMMGVWRVEHFFEQTFINDANYCFNLTNTNNSYNNAVKIVDLYPHENLKIPFTSLTKISSVPIMYHFINENCLILLGKRSSKGTTVLLKYFYGNTKEEEEEVKEKSTDKFNDDVIVNKGRRDSVKTGIDKKENSDEKQKLLQQKK
jgi:phosphopantothenoylcysteine synthetase/decarboxylase